MKCTTLTTQRFGTIPKMIRSPHAPSADPLDLAGDQGIAPGDLSGRALRLGVELPASGLPRRLTLADGTQPRGSSPGRRRLDAGADRDRPVVVELVGRHARRRAQASRLARPRLELELPARGDVVDGYVARFRLGPVPPGRHRFQPIGLGGWPPHSLLPRGITGAGGRLLAAGQHRPADPPAQSLATAGAHGLL